MRHDIGFAEQESKYRSHIEPGLSAPRTLVLQELRRKDDRKEKNRIVLGRYGQTKGDPCRGVVVNPLLFECVEQSQKGQKQKEHHGDIRSQIVGIHHMQGKEREDEPRPNPCARAEHFSGDAIDQKDRATPQKYRNGTSHDKESSIFVRASTKKRLAPG